MEKVIYLEPDDEITSVIDKIRKVTQEKVILVVPKAATILQSIVNLKLLKKESQKMGKNISIVTSDDTGRNLASQIGLTVYRDVAKRPIEEAPRPDIAPEEKDEEIETADEAIAPAVEPVSPDEKPEPQVKPIEAASEKKQELINETEPTQQKPIEKEKASQEKSPGFLDIRPSSVKFKPYKDEKRAGIEKEKSIKPIKPMPGKGSKIKKVILIICFSILGLAILSAIAAYFYLPKANVELVLNAEMINKEIELTAAIEESMDVEKSVVPAEEFSVEKEAAQVFPATGIKNIGEKARGTIAVINETGTDQPLVTNTRFRTSNGLIFRSTTGIVVPKAYLNPLGEKVNGSINVNVVADQVGESYNIGPSSFTIPGLSSSLQSKIYGRNSAAMTGGLTKEIKIVSEEDIIGARTALLKEMSQSASEELNSQINGESYIIPSEGAKETIIEEVAVPPVGTEAAEFNYSLKAKLNILAIKKSDFMDFLSQKIAQDIPSDKEAIMEEVENNLKLSVIAREESRETIVVAITAPIVAKMDEEVIKDNIKKRSSGEAKAYLESFEEIYEANISLWPFFARKVTSTLSRIIINSSYHLPETQEETGT